jgi:hypothetical protein
MITTLNKKTKLVKQTLKPILEQPNQQQEHHGILYQAIPKLGAVQIGHQQAQQQNIIQLVQIQLVVILVLVDILG